MKYIIITPGYPCKENLYNNSFVHSRVKSYIDKGIDVDVFCVNKKCQNDYEFESVKVIQGNYNKMQQTLKKGKYKKILIHFAWKQTFKKIASVCGKTPIIIWVHGVEALGWYRRLFNLNKNIINNIKFIGYIFVNIDQMLFYRSLILNKQKLDITFIFVSNWMKSIVEKDTLTKNKIVNYHIIPNTIDNNLFKYEKKSKNKIYKIFNVRPYHSKKYANDIMVKAIVELSKDEIFKKLTFNLYGDGRLFDKTIKKLRVFKNVNITKGYLSHEEIAKKHDENGILLMPTRQDSQGVSMCEAMSSGLVPVVSNNTAIPEYVNESFGYLCNNYIEMAEAIKEIITDYDKFNMKSILASKFIEEKCSTNNVISKEIKIIRKNGKQNEEN